ncbi:dihydrofolate reductase family protein [Streptosporangium sp. NPDC048047]|uniref:dihydrofolate reductase family protein n=1 Tax=Streptosporangium sp. NPDC048047 TaxID=3155748 RepID=UPI0034338C4F
MSTVILHVTMSLDGFAAGPDVSPENPMGVGGLRLHEWVFGAADDEVDSAVIKELSAATGAVVLGRRTFDVGVGVWGDTPFPAACFVVTHRPQDDLAMRSGTFTFVGDGVERAIRRARAAAGGRNVNLMGIDVARQALSAGLIDEIHLQVAPVLLGGGRRLFEELGTGPVELERTAVAASSRVTHLRFRVVR